MTQRFSGMVARRDALDRFALLFAAVPGIAVSTVIAFTGLLFRDGDIGWHVASGRVILRDGQVPHADPLSYTFAGKPWVAHEWLSDVAMALAYDGAGWAGLAAVSALCLAAALFIIGREFTRFIPARWASILLLLVPAVLLPFVHARPHLFAFPLIAGWVAMLLAARDRQGPPPLWAPALLLLWANLHASFIVGLGLAAAFTLEALLARPAPAVRTRWIWFLLLSVAASLLTPHGVSGLTFPLQVSGMESLSLIGEWARTDPSTDVFFLAAVLLCWTAMIANRRKVEPLRAMIVAGLTVMAFAHIRHQAMFVIVAPMLAARWAGRAGQLPPQASTQGTIAALLAVLMVGARLVVPAMPEDRRAYPMAALSRLPDWLRDRPVLNEYSFGGPLTLVGIRPYIDGRADLYGDRFVADYLRAARGDERMAEALIERHGICWAIFPPDWGIVGLLDRDPAWHRIHADRWAVVQVRRACEPVRK